MKIFQRNLPLAGIVVLSTCVLVIGFFSIQLSQEVNETHEEMNRAKQVLIQTQKLQLAIIYGESNSKSFVMTGSDSMLKQLGNIPKYVNIELRKLQEILKDESVQKQNVDSLSYYIKKRLEFASNLVNTRQFSGAEAATALVKGSQVSNYIFGTRTLIARIQEHENASLLLQEVKRKQSFRNFNLALLTIVAILFILSLISIRQWFINRKQREHSETESRRFAMLLQNISDAVISTDIHFRITGWNKAAEELYGFVEGKTNGLDVAIAAHSKLPNEQSEEYRRQILKNGFGKGEAQSLDAAGKIKSVAFSVNAIRNHKNEITGFVTTVHDITEQKRAEQLLKEFNEELAKQVSEKTAEIKKSEERFNLIAYATNDAVWDWDIEHDTIWGNESFNQYYGINSANGSITYQQFDERVHPDDRVRINNNMQASIAKREEKIFEEFRFQLQNGEYRNILDRCYVKYDDSGKPVRMIGAMMDITQRKETEGKLRQKEERLRAIFNNEPECVKIVDLSGKLLEINPAGLNIIEAETAEQVVGQEILSLIHPDDKAIYKDLHSKVCKGGAGMATFRAYSLNQKPLWMETHSVPLRNESGEIYAVLSVTREITENKLSEIATRKSEEVRKLIMNAALDAIVCMDTDGNITLWNPQAEKTFGWTEAEVMGKSMSAHIVPEQYRQRHEAGFNRYLQTGEMTMMNRLFEMKALNKLKEEFHIELTVVPVKQDDKEFFCAFIRDISGRKAIEEKIKESETNLKTIFDNTSEGFVLTDERGIIKSFNLTAKKSLLNNMDADIIVGCNLIDSIQDQTRRNFLGKMIAEVQSGKSVQYDRNYTQASGEEVWISYSMNPVIENNEVTGICMAGRDITERKKVEELVLANEKRFRGLVENSTDGIAILSTEGVPLYISPAVEKILGYSEQEAMQMEKFSIIHPEDIEAVIKVWEQVMANPGKPIPGYLCRMLHKDGSWRWLEDTMTNMLHEPSIAGIVDNFRDVTEKLNAELQLKENEAKYRTLIEQASDGIIIYSLNGNILEFNTSAYTCMGYSKEELKNVNISSLFFNDDLQEKPLNFEKIKAKQAVIDHRRLKKKDGSSIEMEIATKMLPDGNLMAIARDITERKKAQQALIQSNKRFAYAAQASSDAIWDRNLAEKTINWGEGFRTLFGYDITEETLSVDFWASKVHPEDYPVISKVINDAKENPAVNNWTNQYRFLKADGEYAIVREKAIILRDEKGLTSKTIGALQDITETKLNESILEKLNQQLKMRAEELAASNKELEQFAYIASHDLQEPLRMVTSFLTLLQKRYEHKLDEKAQQYIHFATDGAVRMRRIILDLLEYSRVGKRGFDFEPVDMNKLVNEAIQLNCALIEETNAAISFDHLPVINANKTTILQVLQNLIGNSLKYQHPDKQPIIRVSAEDKDSHWQFEISDNGIGIEEQFFDRIFIVFQRLHNKDEYSGTGIGLAICKKIIENHNGKIWLSSVPGKGSSFYFTINK